MIRRILVALDPDRDTPVAIHYATDIAARHGAEVTGMAIVDVERIETGVRGGGPGSMHYAGKLRDRWMEETREQAQVLVQQFEEAMTRSGVAYRSCVEEGESTQRILEEMKYSDLLVIGKHPHFLYSNPTHETDILSHVLHHAPAPALVVGAEHRPVARVLVAFDGSEQSARTLQSFVQCGPFGTDPGIEVLHVEEGDRAASEQMLEKVRQYLGAHGFTSRATVLSGSKTARQILEHVAASGADAVVAGAHAVSKLRRLAFGSTTGYLLEHSTRPLFLHH